MLISQGIGETGMEAKEAGYTLMKRRQEGGTYTIIYRGRTRRYGGKNEGRKKRPKIAMAYSSMRMQ